MSKRNIALVLASGGARGIAHIGVIRELERRGYRITSVSGTSMGAVIGGFYAMRQMDAYAEFMCSLDQDAVYKLMDFTLTKHGFLKAEKIFKRIEEFIPDQRIEDLQIPYSAVAADLVEKQEVVFTQGSLYRAMRASIAIPAVVTSVIDNDRILVDGGILNPLPLNHVARHEDDILVAVNLYDTPSPARLNSGEHTEVELFEKAGGYIHKIYKGYKNVRKRVVSSKAKKHKDDLKSKGPDIGYISLLNMATTMMSQRIASMSIEIEKPDLVINIPCESIGTFDFHKSQDLIEIGVKVANEALDQFESGKID
ncbi:MAG: patatin-like phospholipase family protein [Bacteroidales bacterium]